jgi:hypothetical protein
LNESANIGNIFKGWELDKQNNAHRGHSIAHLTQTGAKANTQTRDRGARRGAAAGRDSAPI